MGSEPAIHFREKCWDEFLFLKISFRAANMNTYTSVSQFEPYNIDKNLAVTSSTSVSSSRRVGVHCAGHRWHDVWQIKYWGLWRLNIIILYRFFYKINKGDLPLMYSCAFWREFIDLVVFLAVIVWPLLVHSYYRPLFSPCKWNVTTIVLLFWRTERQGSNNNSKKKHV